MTTDKVITIGKRKIGPGQRVFIVAEMSGNHNQSYERARQIIDAAIDAGVDAIKLQTFTPDTITIDCDNKYFQIKVNDVWKGQTLYNLYKTVYTSWAWQPKLKKYAESKGVMLFSTPFDETAVDFLEKMKVALYKVASFETGDLELLKKIGQTKKPVIMSRGLTDVSELKLAIKTLKKAGAPQVAVLQCISSYPAVPEQMNLATIPDIAKRFDVIVGLSDHTLSTVVALTSVALGACIIEKHFTLRRADGGPDAAFSLEPAEMKQLVAAVREAEKAIGQPTYQIGKKESENLVFRRSLFVVKDIKKGKKFSRENVRCIRPGYGLAPKHLEKILGKTAARKIKKGTPLEWNLILKK
jgi:pseudaminic acid synthase